MTTYPWYTVVSNNSSISQGDIFKSCPIVVASVIDIKAGQEIEAEVYYYDVVVMSQSCDLEHGKIDIVLVCPVWPLNEVATQREEFRGKRGKEKLRRGNVVGFHLLNKIDDLSSLEQDFLVVDFKNVYGVRFDILTELASNSSQRLRLLPPYREHLSQAFARFFMRVGLPIDIPPFT